MMPADLPPPPPAIERLAPCPERPNCVSSLATDEAHRIDPLPLDGSPEAALERLRELIEAMPRATVVESAPGYLKVQFRSLLLRFVDELELAADPSSGVIHLRSAARSGYSDFGVNRRRVERLRSRYR